MSPLAVDIQFNFVAKIKKIHLFLSTNKTSKSSSNGGGFGGAEGGDGGGASAADEEQGGGGGGNEAEANSAGRRWRRPWSQTLIWRTFTRSRRWNGSKLPSEDSQTRVWRIRIVCCSPPPCSLFGCVEMENGELIFGLGQLIISCVFCV